VEVTGAPLPRNLKARRSRKSNPRFSALIQAIIHNKNDARALRKRILLSNSDLSNIFSQFVADLIVALSYSIKESILGRLVKIKGES
jgi:hypothetical protein